MIGGEEAGTEAGTLPVALAYLLDTIDRIGRCEGFAKGLDLSQNPWQHPSEAIVAGGMPEVRGYFEAIFRGGTTIVARPLKVAIIGKENAGKTRLIGSQWKSFVVYYGFLQLFLTPRAVYLLVWDAAEASEMDDLDLEELAIAPWLRYLNFRVPDASVTLGGDKWDRVVKAKRHVVKEVEDQSYEWLSSWWRKLMGINPTGFRWKKASVE
eukprot:g20719.t1